MKVRELSNVLNGKVVISIHIYCEDVKGVAYSKHMDTPISVYDIPWGVLDMNVKVVTPIRKNVVDLIIVETVKSYESFNELVRNVESEVLY